MSDTDVYKFEEFEKNIYDDFIFAAQMCRGKIAGIKVIQL
jgi:hypothetical protein